MIVKQVKVSFVHVSTYWLQQNERAATNINERR